jgi:hypothetical protein
VANDVAAVGHRNPRVAGLAGSDGGADRWAIVCPLITTAKLNDREPYAYLKDVIERMANGHPANRLDDLLAWSWHRPNRRVRKPFIDFPWCSHNEPF